MRERLNRRRWVYTALVSLTVLVCAGCQVGPASPTDEPVEPDTSPRFSATVDDRTYFLSSVTCTLNLPMATGGNGPLVYSLTPAVPGWSFDATERTLTVATTRVGTWDVTYRVEDTDANTSSTDADELMFTISVTTPGDDTSQPEEGITSWYRGCGNQVFFLNPEGSALDQTLYTLTLGDASGAVYLIATNTTAAPANTRIERLDTNAATTTGKRSATGVGRVSQALRYASAASVYGQRSVTEFNNDPPVPAAASPSLRSDLQPRQTVMEGDRALFYDVFDEQNPMEVPVTARRVVTDNRITAVFWVADSTWGTCSECIRPEMVKALADRFLRPGADNDIYDWVTAIFGHPWGTHDQLFLIPGEYADQLHIFLTDVEGAGGYFPAADAYLRDPDAGDIRLRLSNERLMLVVDSSVLANAQGPTWEITDPDPSYAVSTLAHELQHMIHFYQKLVEHDFETVSETWINEMASDLTEDLVAEKLMRVSRRGVAHDDPTAGERENTRGRFPTYNYYNYLQSTKWEYDAPLFRYYAINYALGVYLALTYGGAPLFGEIVQNDRSGIEAIEAALAAQGHPVSFEDVLTGWAVANLLSDDTEAPHPYRYNSGTWSTSEAGGVTFRLGSVDLFNYRYYYAEGLDDYHDGPYFFSTAEFNADGVQAAHSNRYVRLGENTGTVRLRVDAPAGSRITVLVKE